MKSALDNRVVGMLSLHGEARREAERHKWIESQKEGRDLGVSALQEWYHVYWRHYCRCKRMEHVEGSRHWEEYGDDDFGRLSALIQDKDLLVDRILDRVYLGFENLDLINWAFDWGLPMDRVLEVLGKLDVNRARMEPETL